MGIGVSLFLMAVGAILAFAVNVSSDGINLDTVGVILIILGGWFLVDRYLNIDSALVLPAVLIVLGGVLVVGALGRSGNRQ